MTGCETGIDVGLKVDLIAADGEVVESPRHFRTAERQLAKAQRRVSRRKNGSHRRREAIGLLKRKHQKVQRHSGSGATSITRPRSRCSAATTPSIGLVLDRDENAALTMLRAGQARQALTQRVAAYVA